MRKVRVHVLYFYQEIGKIKPNEINDGLIHNSPLIASVDKTIKRLDYGLSHKVRPFELQQDRLIGLVTKSKSLGIDITGVEFVNDIDQEITEELIYALSIQDFKKVKELLYEVSLHFETDILAVTYVQEGRHYRLTKHAVAEIPADLNELQNLAFSAPIAFATGITNFPIGSYLT